MIDRKDIFYERNLQDLISLAVGSSGTNDG